MQVENHPLVEERFEGNHFPLNHAWRKGLGCVYLLSPKPPSHSAYYIYIYVLQAILYIHIFPEGSVYASSLIWIRRVIMSSIHLVQVVWKIPEKRRPKNNSTYRRLNQFDQTNGLQKNILGGLGSRQTSLYMKFTSIFFWGELAPRKNGRTISTWTT